MYRHPYDIEARNQLARERAERLERDMRWAEKHRPIHERSSQ